VQDEAAVSAAAAKNISRIRCRRELLYMVLNLTLYV
jgi:hypothetical protein